MHVNKKRSDYNASFSPLMRDLHDRNQCPVEMQKTENVSFMIPKMLKSQLSN